MKHIAVLLTVYNRKDKTLACLQRLYALSAADDCCIDVWLTDDGCTDGTPEAITAQYPEVHVIHADGNLFWNRGMHLAWQTAAEARDYDFYLWLNDDTFVYAHLLQQLLSLSAAQGDRAIVVGPTQSADHTCATYGGRRPDGRIPVPNGTAQHVRTFNGNIVLIPRAVYKRLGNLDPYYSHSKGDFDYGLRATEAGIPILQVGQYLGECEAHPTLDAWCNPAVPLATRLRMLNRPNGMPPRETFHLERRHVGLLPAAFHFCTIYLRCLCPWIWALRSSNN